MRKLRLSEYQLLAATLPTALSTLSTTFAGALSLTFARPPAGSLIGLLAGFVGSASSLALSRALSRAWSLARWSCTVSSWHNATSLIDGVVKSCHLTCF